MRDVSKSDQKGFVLENYGILLKKIDSYGMSGADVKGLVRPMTSGVRAEVPGS
jgi:hypothetical protein